MSNYKSDYQQALESCPSLVYVFSPGLTRVLEQWKTGERSTMKMADTLGLSPLETWHSISYLMQLKLIK